MTKYCEHCGTNLSQMHIQRVMYLDALEWRFDMGFKMNAEDKKLLKNLRQAVKDGESDGFPSRKNVMKMVNKKMKKRKIPSSGVRFIRKIMA